MTTTTINKKKTQITDNSPALPVVLMDEIVSLGQHLYD